MTESRETAPAVGHAVRRGPRSKRRSGECVIHGSTWIKSLKIRKSVQVFITVIEHFSPFSLQLVLNFVIQETVKERNDKSLESIFDFYEIKWFFKSLPGMTQTIGHKSARLDEPLCCQSTARRKQNTGHRKARLEPLLI